MDYFYIALFVYVFVVIFLQKRTNEKFSDEIHTLDGSITQALNHVSKAFDQILSLSKRYNKHLDTDISQMAELKTIAQNITQKINSLSQSVDILQNKEIDSLIDEQEGLMKQGEKNPIETVNNKKKTRRGMKI